MSSLNLLLSRGWVQLVKSFRYLSMPMRWRLARVMQAKVLWCIATMTETGYQVEISEAWENFPTNDPHADTCRLNAELETFIRQQPDQYLWVHRRFKTRPEGEHSLY